VPPVFKWQESGAFEATILSQHSGFGRVILDIVGDKIKENGAGDQKCAVIYIMSVPYEIHK